MKNQPRTLKNHWNRLKTMKTDLEPWKTNLEPWKTIKTNLNHWKPIKTEMEPWKTNLEPSKLTQRVVMGGSGGYRRLPGGSDHFSWQTDRQTHHHNIYIMPASREQSFNVNANLYLYKHKGDIISLLRLVCVWNNHISFKGSISRYFEY